MLFRSQDTEPTHINSWINKAYIFGQTGRMEEAATTVKRISQLAPNVRLEHAPGFLSINVDVANEQFIDGLRKIGFPE